MKDRSMRGAILYEMVLAITLIALVAVVAVKRLGVKNKCNYAATACTQTMTVTGGVAACSWGESCQTTGASTADLLDTVKTFCSAAGDENLC